MFIQQNLPRLGDIYHVGQVFFTIYGVEDENNRNEMIEGHCYEPLKNDVLPRMSCTARQWTENRQQQPLGRIILQPILMPQFGTIFLAQICG